MELCNEIVIRGLLERHGFRFSRSMGQNFLIDPSIPAAIAEASGAEIRELRALSAMPAGERWYLSGEDQVFEGRALVLAAGAVRGKPLPGEERLLGRGVSYVCIYDANSGCITVE